jgi:hypothetical protein
MEKNGASALGLLPNRDPNQTGIHAWSHHAG